MDLCISLKAFSQYKVAKYNIAGRWVGRGGVKKKKPGEVSP